MQWSPRVVQRAIAAEFVGFSLLVAFGCGILTGPKPDTENSLQTIAPSKLGQ